MGSGKSTIGKILADQISFEFLDLDEFIENREGRTIAEIFYHEGEQYFRNLESDALKELSNKDGLVVSLGGGTPCHSNNMETINNKGFSIFLQIGPEALSKRLFSERMKRPLISNVISEEELLIFIDKKLKKRNLDYLKANFVIDGALSPAEVVNLVRAEIEK